MNQPLTQISIPVACRLTEPELQERRAGVLREASKAVLEVAEREDGFVYRFASSDETLQDLFLIMKLEHKCCPFLRMSVTVEPGDDGSMWLEMSGPEGTKDFLSSLFDLAYAGTATLPPERK